MASSSSHAPLLDSPRTTKAFSFKKSLVFVSSLAALIGLIALSTHHVIHHSLYSLNKPSVLCAHSPNPAACIDIVSSTNSAGRSPKDLFHSILRRSLHDIRFAQTNTANIRLRVNGPLRPPLDDCLELLDLSHDRIISSISAFSSGSFMDSRTWLSAVLTNHVTCREGLDGLPNQPIRAELDSLTAQASAALAVLRAIAGDNVDELGTVTDLPPWVGPAERVVLNAFSPAELAVDVTVAKDGSGNYRTLQAAVDSAPANSKGRFTIYVKAGTYKENVQVGKNKKNITIVGDGMNATVISGSLNFVDGSTTFNSATLAAVGDGFILQDLCVENTAGPEKHQAVAVRIGADKSVVNRCQIRGYQDTLYAHSLRQFYRDSLISGTIDYIFGNAAVVFQKCNLVARKPLANQKNAVTAQGRTDKNQNTGTSIQDCRIVPASDLVPVKGSIPTYLGRPWKEYSRTVVMQSYIDNHVNPKGWLEWDGDFALQTLYYGEYNNYGPGAGTAGRVKWPGYHVITNPQDAVPFTVAVLIQGNEWLASTKVPFTAGL
ncbi:hypothetical protein HPP92_018451 [Vanilla planifolia]|uniref:Pectinesterase n=1 Tax=Vanilla planifolia TaxID=51239 RepID=A0A835UPE3_VANPL|nr:hypothetical protein HPP92_018451 [Vanilla planifolia]